MTTTYTYDDFHHQTIETDGDGYAQAWTVNAFGQVSAYVNMSKDVTRYYYDDAGHLTGQAEVTVNPDTLPGYCGKFYRQFSCSTWSTSNIPTVVGRSTSDEWN